MQSSLASGRVGVSLAGRPSKQSAGGQTAGGRASFLGKERVRCLVLGEGHRRQKGSGVCVSGNQGAL